MYLTLLKLTGKPLYTAAQQYCTVAYISTTYILFVSKTKKDVERNEYHQRKAVNNSNLTSIPTKLSPRSSKTTGAEMGGW